MGKTIEERMIDLVTTVVWNNANDCVDISAATIIEPWNAAVKAMKTIVSVDLDTKHGAHYCHGCHSDLPNHSERHKPETCRIAALQAAIAKMEGTDV